MLAGGQPIRRRVKSGEKETGIERTNTRIEDEGGTTTSSGQSYESIYGTVIFNYRFGRKLVRRCCSSVADQQIMRCYRFRRNRRRGWCLILFRNISPRQNLSGDFPSNRFVDRSTTIKVFSIDQSVRRTRLTLSDFLRLAFSTNYYFARSYFARDISRCILRLFSSFIDETRTYDRKKCRYFCTIAYKTNQRASTINALIKTDRTFSSA